MLVGETCEYHSRGEEYGTCHFRETCGYHSRGEEHGVISKRPVGNTTDWRGMVLAQGRPVSTANR